MNMIINDNIIANDVDELIFGDSEQVIYSER